MSVAELDDQLLTALAADRDETAPGWTLSELVDALDLSSDRLSSQIELATTIDELREEGLVERDASGTADGEAALVLTDDGENRAAAVRERLAETTIELVDGHRRRELALSTAAADLDRPLVEIAANVTADGVYYREARPTGDRVVGRDAERERVRGEFEAVRETGGGRAVFLTGPGGVGKTTFAEALLEDAREEFGFAVARARGQGSREAYQPLRELLAALEPDAAPFADVGSAVEDPEEFRARQNALFYDLTDHLAPADDEPPRLLFLDDLHLADAGTMAYLGNLVEGEQLADRRLIVVGSYRAAALSDDAPVAAETVPGDAPVAHLRLGPLDREGTRDTIERVVERRGAPDAFVDAIYERTGGNPLFVEETVARLLETDQLDPRFEWYPDEPDAIDVPDAVRETIDRRVAALDDDAQMVLRWAALIGERVPLDVLQSTCDLPDPRFETLLEALVGADVFDRSTDGDAVAFRSEVVREALLEDLSASDRRERHGTIAAALEALDRGTRPESIADSDGDDAEDIGTGDRAAAIAAHHERAGNREAAIEWYRRAADRATDVYAHDAAIEHYRGALALAKDGDEETLLSIAERLAEIYQTTGEFESARRHLEFVRERTDDPHRRRRVYGKLSEVAKHAGDFDRALSFAEEGLALADDPADEETCELLHAKGAALRLLGRYDDALVTCEREIDLAAEIDDGAHRATAFLAAGVVRLVKGDLDGAEPLLRDALELARETDQTVKVAKAYNNLAALYERRNDFDTSLSLYERARDLRAETGAVRMVAHIDSNIGANYTRRGDVDRALEDFRRARETARRIGDTYLRTLVQLHVADIDLQRAELESCLDNLAAVTEAVQQIGARELAAEAEYNRAQVHYYRGSIDEMTAAVERLHEIARETDDKMRLANAIGYRGVLSRLEGDVESAVDHHRKAIDLLEQYGQDMMILENRFELALTCAARDDAEGVSEQADAIESLATEYDAGRVALARGIAARLAGDDAAAADALETALAESRAKDDRLTAFRVLEQQARLALARDEDERAREIATDLETRAADRGLELFADRAREIRATCQ